MMFDLQSVKVELAPRSLIRIHPKNGEMVKKYLHTGP